MKRVITRKGKPIPHPEGEPNFYLISRSHPLPSLISSTQDSTVVPTTFRSSPNTGEPFARTHAVLSHEGRQSQWVQCGEQIQMTNQAVQARAEFSGPILPMSCQYQIAGMNNAQQYPLFRPDHSSVPVPIVGTDTVMPPAQDSSDYMYHSSSAARMEAPQNTCESLYPTMNQNAAPGHQGQLLAPPPFSMLSKHATTMLSFALQTNSPHALTAPSIIQTQPKRGTVHLLVKCQTL